MTYVREPLTQPANEVLTESASSRTLSRSWIDPRRGQVYSEFKGLAGTDVVVCVEAQAFGLVNNARLTVYTTPEHTVTGVENHLYDQWQ